MQMSSTGCIRKMEFGQVCIRCMQEAFLGMLSLWYLGEDDVSWAIGMYADKLG